MVCARNVGYDQGFEDFWYQKQHEPVFAEASV